MLRRAASILLRPASSLSSIVCAHDGLAGTAMRGAAEAAACSYRAEQNALLHLHPDLGPSTSTQPALSLGRLHNGGSSSILPWAEIGRFTGHMQHVRSIFGAAPKKVNKQIHTHDKYKTVNPQPTYK